MSFQNVGQLDQDGEALAAALYTDVWTQSYPQDAA